MIAVSVHGIDLPVGDPAGKVVVRSANHQKAICWPSGEKLGVRSCDCCVVDYWTPQLELAECRAKRALICALDE